MRTVKNGDNYDIEEWAAWFRLHGLDIADVRAADVHDSGKVRVYLYDADDEGRRFVDDNDNVVLLPPVVIRNPKMPVPDFTELVDRSVYVSG